MKRHSASFMAISLATVVSILTVGLTVSLSVRQGAFDRGVKACVSAIAIRVPQRDAAADFERGERRFFFNGFNEWDLRRSAKGVVLKRNPAGGLLKGCSKDEPNVWRELPFGAFSRYMLVRHGDPFNGSIDPIYSPRTACGKADEIYIRTYNAEMARISPSSIKEYCD